MRREFYLLSIIPNQQSRLRLQGLRHHLFQAHGLASAMAFEPVIPLAWFEAPVDSSGYARFSTGKDKKNCTDTLPQQPSTPRIELGEPKFWASHLYISVIMQPESLLQELILAAGQSPVPGSTLQRSTMPASMTPEGGSPPIPATEGIFLAANEAEITGTLGVGFSSGAKSEHSSQADLLQTTENRLAQQFSADRSLGSTRIGMYSICFSPDFRQWWEHVEWTLEWKIQLKRA